jgi:branched-chain amino acid transport system substrate-binding protein
MMKKGTTVRAIALGAAIAVVVILVALLRSLPSGLNAGQSASDAAAIVQYQEPGRFSRGERALFTDAINADLNHGIEAFNLRHYSDAIKQFQKAVQGDLSQPEPQIYLNNARSRLIGVPFTLAAVVPVDNASTSALEMLRGIADAQTKFNESGGLNNRLLEIVIANDGNEVERATRVAQQLIQDDTVLGIIGHNSSAASKAGLAEYTKAELAMVTPTSGSTQLANSPVFFRTIVSNEQSSKKLAEYANRALTIKKVAIFSSPKDPFSVDAQKYFEQYFRQLGGQTIQFDLSDSKLDPEAAIAKSVYQENAGAVLLLPSTDLTSVAMAIAQANSALPAADKMKLLGITTMYKPNTLNSGGEAVRGLVLAIPWFAKAKQSIPFAQKAAERWKGQVNFRTAASFDATQALIKALSEHPTRKNIIQNLRSTNLQANDTSGDPVQFSAKGERIGEPVLVEVKRTGTTPAYSFELVE